jgi:hypothetical protein
MQRAIREWLASLRALDAGALLFTLAAAAVWLLATLRSPLLVPDTNSYVLNHVTRTPVYPLLLDAMEAIADSGMFAVVAVVQVGFGLLCVLRFSAALRNGYGIGGAAATIASLALMVPLARFGSVMMPECVAYGLFLWTAALLLEGIARPAPLRMIAASSLATVLVLTRPQYLFLYPVLLLVLAGQLLERRERAMVFAAALSVALLASQSLVQRAYNYAENGVFQSIPFAGIQLLAVQMFLSDAGDGVHASSPAARSFFDTVRPRLVERELTAAQTADQLSVRSYNQMIFGVFIPTYRETVAGHQDLTPDDWVAMDELTVGLSRDLALAEPMRYARHMAREIYQQQRYFVLLLPGCILVSIWMGATRRDRWWAAVGVFALAGCANYLLVACIEPLQFRYAYATDNLVVAMVLVSMMRAAPPRDGAP